MTDWWTYTMLVLLFAMTIITNIRIDLLKKILDAEIALLRSEPDKSEQVQP